MNQAKRRQLLESAMRKEQAASGRPAPSESPATPQSLVAEKMQLTKYMAPLDDEAMALQAELRILRELEASAKPLMREYSQLKENEQEEPKRGVRTGPLNWTMPDAYSALSAEAKRTLFMNGGIVLEDATSFAESWVPVQKFEHMKLPKYLRTYLRRRREIIHPTPIQQSALPVALSGRDLLGVAGTGSGKTLCYLLPLVLLSYHQEKTLPFEPGEGPCALVMVPNRELALQVQAIGQEMLDAVCDATRVRPMRFEAIIGGVPVRDQQRALARSGCHGVVGTPGRLKDLLEQKILKLDLVKFLVLDEADRLLDEGFNEPIRCLCHALAKDLQTILFSATMPPRVKQFAQSSLTHPVTIYVGKAGRASSRVTQKLDILAPASRPKFLLMAIQETPPPVVVFCGNKLEVDEVLENLIVAGVEAAAIHGGLDQRDRSRALLQFTSGEKDVLIGTDVASKGLDLPNVQHVINYTLPQDVEDYIHRIGRTGRKGSRGLATSFVSSVFDETLLLDLRGILLEAQQRVPRFLHTLAKARGLPDEHIECAFCGGPGHRVMTCAKLQAYRMRQPNALMAAMN